MIEFEYVHPNDLGKKWAIVKEGMDKIHAKSLDTWIVEDIYVALKTNASTLHIAWIGGEYKGFMVLQPTNACDGQVLHIWATYSIANDFDVFTDGIETIKDFAKKMNAVRITFGSPRRGWEKYSEKIGFTPRTLIYAMELDMNKDTR